MPIFLEFSANYRMQNVQTTNNCKERFPYSEYTYYKHVISLFLKKSHFCLIHMNNKLINDKKISVEYYTFKEKNSGKEIEFFRFKVRVGSGSTFSVDPQHCM